MRFGCGRVAADAALAALLDHDLLGPAMAEALAYGARLDARLERQGLGRDTQSLVARRFGINHSAVLISLRCAYPHPSLKRVSQNFWPLLSVLSSSAIRYRTRIWQRDRNVLLAGPASRAACITFDRPSAKSNSADVKTLMVGKPCDSPIFPCFCRRIASNLRIPSAAPSEAWISAWACPCASAPSTLLKPETTWPAL